MIKIIKYVRKYYLHIALAATACVGASATTVMLTDFLRNLVDKNAANQIWKIIFILIIGIGSNYLVVYMTGYIGAGLLRDLRADCIKSLLKASPGYMSDHSCGDIMERVSADVEGLADFIKGYFKDCLYVPIMAVVYSVYLLSIHPVLAAFCLAPLVILVPINIKYMKPVKLMQFEYSRRLGLTNNLIWEAFDGAATIKAYNLQERMQKKYYSALHRLLKISNDTDLKQYNLEPVSRAIQELPIAIALILGGFLVFDGKITMGILIAYISVLRSFVDPLSMCYQLVVRSQTAIVSAARVFEIIDIPREREGIADERADRASDKRSDELSGGLSEEEPAIAFENVSFRYGADDKNTLSNISFQIRKGEHVAFIGKSGSGKSTVLKLIATLLEADEGRIKIFGRDYSGLAPEFIRQKLAYVSQDAILFPLPAVDNVRIGNPAASAAQLADAIKKAGCESFAEVILTEHGSNLSGGQRQRLAMARAMIKDADIYLFDEPTSALDSETESAVCRTIDALPKDKTVITVAHKLSAIRGYDRIYTVENGRITKVEGGSL